MRLVLEGFQSERHLVDHPSLGVFCGNGIGGALIQEVTPGSPAAHIGLKEGDIIQQLGPYEIRNKIDFAKVLFKVRAGARLPLRYSRDGHTNVREVILGGSPD
jgi:serine protease Do